jgi:hypothetical protein
LRGDRLSSALRQRADGDLRQRDELLIVTRHLREARRVLLTPVAPRAAIRAVTPSASTSSEPAAQRCSSAPTAISPSAT